MDTNYLKDIQEAAGQRNRAIPEDYRDSETGLLVCGQCGGFKEARVALGGVERIVPVNCTCKEREYLRSREDLEQAMKRERINCARERCFGKYTRKGEYTFKADDSQNAKSSRIARDYANGFSEKLRQGEGLLLLGTTGTGKTFYACAIANGIIDMGYSARVTNFADIEARLQSVTDKSSVYDELCRCDLLVLDDLGSERETPYMEEIIFKVVDDRCAAKKPLIVTTNLTTKELMSSGNLARDRVFSRLCEMCEPVPVTGKDRRREKLIAHGRATGEAQLD